MMDYLLGLYVWAYFKFLDVDYKFTGGYLAATYL